MIGDWELFPRLTLESKIISMKPTILIQSRIPQQSMPTFALVFAPFIVIKRAVVALQSALEDLIWAELIHGKTPDNNLFQAVAFVAFCVFCLLAYFADDFLIPLILIQSVLCQCERWLARYVYYNGKGAIATLEKTANTYQWQLTYANGKSDSEALLQAVRRRFKIHEVEGIEIRRRQVYVGLSGQPIAVVWQIDLQLVDLSFLPVSTESNLGNAIAKVRSLAQELQVPFTFAKSEPLLANHLRSRLSPSVTYRPQAQGWQIITGWKIEDNWKLLGKIFDRAGFLLFAIILGGFAAKFGDFLVRLFVAWREEGMILLDMSPFFEIMNGLSSFEWLGLLVALGIMVWEGARLSLVKQLICDRYVLRLQIAGKQVACISNEVEGIVFFSQPTPLLAIWDKNNQTIEITDLPRLDDYREIGFQVSQSLIPDKK